MNRLRELRGDVLQKDKARELGVDASMMSRYERGACNPTVDTVRRICEHYGKDVFEVWERGDLDYAKLSRRAEKRRQWENIRKLSVRIDTALANRIAGQMAALKIRTQAEYLTYCADMIEKRLKKRKGRTVTDMTDAAEKKTI